MASDSRVSTTLLDHPKVHDPVRFDVTYKQVERVGLWGFPIKNDGSKRPLVQWKQFQDRPPTPDELVEWRKKYPCAGVGIPTGSATGIVIVDADNNDAISYLESHTIPKTWTLLTRRGVHYYFTHPDFVITNSAGRIAEHIDVRGRGGFGVSPGSLGKDGFVYSWKTGSSPDDLRLADLPAGWRICFGPSLPPRDRQSNLEPSLARPAHMHVRLLKVNLID